MVENRGTAEARAPSIVERLGGKTILVTGVTGFLGQALLERLLLDIPEARAVALVRPKLGQSGRQRLEHLVRGNAFRVLREREGDEGVRRILDERVDVVEGDFTTEEPPAFPPGIDVVVHCAATVAFDEPIDEAFQTNLLGALRLYRAVRDGGSTPHLVHVSTAYVAGTRKGVIPEATLEHRVDWRTEADLALAVRREVEAASRRPEQLDRFLARAKAEHSRAGPQSVAADAEERRRDWVAKRLTEYGRARAQTLGWPDVYTFTKAMGERAVEELAAEAALPLSILRPSIIESALLHPYPGWIEGFKMADPIILAYGRGAIPEFPGIPEGIVDIIPVDLVVNAMLAVAASPPEPGAAAYYHVGSGFRNPLQYRELYEHVREYFQRHPLPERDRGDIKVPEWRFPGHLTVERMLRTGERLVEAAEKVVTHLPKSKRMRDLVSRVDRERSRLGFVRRYADLYGAYTEAEVIYTDDRTLELFRSLPPEDRARFPFDARIVDWKHYLQDVHCPSVTTSLRALSTTRPRPTVQVRERDRLVLAVFDMEGTILPSNVVESYVWARLADATWDAWPAELASVFSRIPSYLLADRRDRGEFLRTFFRRFEGASVEGVDRLVDEVVTEFMLQKTSAAAVRRIREHRAAGHRTVLITAAAEPFVRPLAPLFDVVIAARLAVRDGRYTGYLAEPPLVGEARAAWLRRYAERTGADLRHSYAYADSHSDLALLRAVGNPVAVSPDSALYRVARRRRWPIEEWGMAGGMPRVRFPRPAVR
ncbi:MAG TPA: HAD-IB family hydrolase [Actinomycetota bacterium]|nr:HAD-IB family hydrolase [Actinomycetota bacterium]